ncbi:hypothetical protein RND71_039866 [Anisodus tanguticus]|uniref:Uncharacterized protein n=1 Tax=Anisodus tanguticus TaxID=243964 RepID=A0AAE1UY71_9SOLA|nr:hypothetical protein RND71_039866 [Anisodus tanguticus]
MLEEKPLQIIHPLENHGSTDGTNNQFQLDGQVENIEEQIDKAKLIEMRDMFQDETMDKNLINISHETDLSPRQEKSMRSTMKNSNKINSSSSSSRKFKANPILHYSQKAYEQTRKRRPLNEEQGGFYRWIPPPPKTEFEFKTKGAKGVGLERILGV